MKGNKYRTHNCGELRTSNVGESVVLSGWLFRRRDHGGVLFVDIRDGYGLTQVVFDDNVASELAASTSLESVVTVRGVVRARPEDSANSKLPTGCIEVYASQDIEVESEADALPMPVDSDADYQESMRLRHRYLDLRRDHCFDKDGDPINFIRHAVKLRADVAAFVRENLSSQGFLEVQTPLLTGSSPEGARDFLVPSRLHKGSCYALPQAPQLFKQLLMLSGFDKYFQIAPCFRDEDSRADRSPGEFYQIDLEMAFATQEDVFNVAESLLFKLFTNFSKNEVTATPFPRISYKEALSKYGSDKPDLRNPLFAVDVTEVFVDSDFGIFRNNVAKGLAVRAIAVDNIADRSRKFFDDLIESAKKMGASGLAYIVFDAEGNPKGPIAKFLDERQLALLRNLSGVKNNGGVFFISDAESKANAYINGVRRTLGEALGLIAEGCFSFCWVVDFPMYEMDDATGALQFMHNPFSMPQGGIDALNNQNPLDIIAYQYDIVCNGIELSSGAIRNHKIDWLYQAFALAGYDQSQVDASFPALTSALRYGAPPHGGIAPGFDRIIMMLAEKPNIREVICFPLTQNGEDLMMGAPSRPSAKQLADLGLHIK